MSRVLIVDDDVQILDVISRMFADLKGEFECVRATSGEEALRLARKQPIDILLTDLRLPGMDGFELVRQIVALRAETRIIVMTGFHTAEARAQAEQHGALQILEKPLDMHQLLRLLRTAAAPIGWSGSVRGLDIFDLTQLLLMTRRNRNVLVRAGEKTGVLVIANGSIRHASTRQCAGADAFYEMVTWEGGTFEDMPPGNPQSHPDNVDIPTNQLMLEAARRHDEGLLSMPESNPVESSALEKPLAQLVAGSGVTLDACVVGSDGTIQARSYTRLGLQRDIDGLALALNALIDKIQRPALQRLILEDAEGTIVVCSLNPASIGRLVVMAEAGLRMGALTAEARRLAQGIESHMAEEK